jgi:L-ascorbate metabolism protein UlaG (beta-lactamase superfamily)
MELQFHGANCITITNKHARIVIDDNLVELGGKGISKPGDITLFTSTHKDTPKDSKIVIDMPGEYEASGVSIYGIAARSHMDEDKKKSATMYKIVFDDFRILVTGHIFPELSDAQLEAIGMVDVMFVPVGGFGYTMDGLGALKLIRKIEPKLVIPTHFEDAALTFPVAQQPLAEALQQLAMEPKETVAKLKLKPIDLADTTQLVVLEKQ